MKRNLYKDLLEWKKASKRKPLVLFGVRQVGKSYLIEEFGKNEYNSIHIFNFEEDKFIHNFFNKDLQPKRIIEELISYSGKIINLDEDLVVFDEIQECPNAITSLKYFCEDLNELHLCAAGS